MDDTKQQIDEIVNTILRALRGINYTLISHSESEYLRRLTQSIVYIGRKYTATYQLYSFKPLYEHIKFSAVG